MHIDVYAAAYAWRAAECFPAPFRPNQRDITVEAHVDLVEKELNSGSPAVIFRKAGLSITEPSESMHTNSSAMMCSIPFDVARERRCNVLFVQTSDL